MSREEAQEFAREHSLIFAETSAARSPFGFPGDTCVATVFAKVARAMRATVPQGTPAVLEPAATVVCLICREREGDHAQLRLHVDSLWVHGLTVQAAS